jgi:hypothetical protein
LSFSDWQHQTADAAIDSIYLLNHAIIDIWQRNSDLNLSQPCQVSSDWTHYFIDEHRVAPRRASVDAFDC